MTTAKRIVDAVAIVAAASDALIVDCADYDAFAALPKVVEFEGLAYVLTGWNSDNGKGYYKRSNQFARALTAPGR